MNAPNGYHRLVVKLGTSITTGGTAHISPRRMLEIVRQVAVLHERGLEIAVVTSGAVAAGRDVLGNPDLGKNIPAKQMLAAIGQPRLMQTYAELFAIFGLHVAQVLLTRADILNRHRYLNARDTFNALLEQRIIPIINENDTVATEEIKVGDNDNLSALVANLIDADLLVLLTDQPGLFSTNPRSDPNAKLIPLVEQINDEVWEIAGGSGTSLGTGGMRTKIQAAQLATRSGTEVVIAQGSRPEVLIDLIGEGGAQIGTWFQPVSSRVESFKRWLLSERPQGRVMVDAGAARTLLGKRASLLPVGVTGVEGEFERGMVISVSGPTGDEIARGVTHYSAADLSQICGLRSDLIATTLGYTYGDEVIHRAYLVVL
jgi:glutamate 5-kinase